MMADRRCILALDGSQSGTMAGTLAGLPDNSIAKYVSSEDLQLMLYLTGVEKQ